MVAFYYAVYVFYCVNCILEYVCMKRYTACILNVHSLTPTHFNTYLPSIHYLEESRVNYFILLLDISSFTFFICSYLILPIFSGEFLTRNTSDNKNLKTKNLNIELLKADYEALLDKLICPSCKNEQSFDEIFEKIRECRRCNEKFVRAKTSNSSSFAKTNKENEEKRLLRLKNIEDGVYGNLGNFLRYYFLSHLFCFKFIVCVPVQIFISTYLLLKCSVTSLKLHILTDTL